MTHKTFRTLFQVGISSITTFFLSFSPVIFSQSKTTDQCHEYNSLYYRISGLESNEREKKCNRQIGCYFEGIGWNGQCKTLAVKGKNQKLSLSSSTPDRIYSLLVTNEKNSDVVVAIEGIVKESITSSVADSIEQSHEAAHEVAKELVIQVLQNTDNVQNVGIFLERIFSDESVLESTRSLSYFHLHTSSTLRNILYQLNWLRFYYCRGGGKVS
jgi:hypothetical protein